MVGTYHSVANYRNFRTRSRFYTSYHFWLSSGLASASFGHEGRNYGAQFQGRASYSPVSSLNIPAGTGCSNFNVNRVARASSLRKLWHRECKLLGLIETVLRIKISRLLYTARRTAVPAYGLASRHSALNSGSLTSLSTDTSLEILENSPLHLTDSNR